MRLTTLRTWRQSICAAGLLVALASSAYAKESVIAAAEVPAPVLATLKKLYPAAKLDRFELEEENGKRCFEVKLQLGTRVLEAKLSAAGELLEEEEVIAEKDLPEPVRKSLAGSRYAHAKIHKIERVVHKDQADRLTFEVKVIDGGKKVELLYDATGKLLGSE